MKTIIILIASTLLGFTTAVSAQDVSKQDKGKIVTEKKNGPVADFDKLICDLGELTQNAPQTAEFKVTNKGNEPLIFSSATASCGCTNLTWSQEPVLPGKSTIISATYNAAALGNFMKTITVKSNASEQPVILQIKGKVNAKAAQ